MVVLQLYYLFLKVFRNGVKDSIFNCFEVLTYFYLQLVTGKLEFIYPFLTLFQ